MYSRSGKESQITFFGKTFFSPKLSSMAYLFTRSFPPTFRNKKKKPQKFSASISIMGWGKPECILRYERFICHDKLRKCRSLSSIFRGFFVGKNAFTWNAAVCFFSSNGSKSKFQSYMTCSFLGLWRPSQRIHNTDSSLHKIQSVVTVWYIKIYLFYI